MSLTSLIKWPVHDRMRHYPDMRPLDAALVSDDWPAVVSFFAQLPPEHDPSVTVWALAQRPGLEHFLERAGGGPRHSSLAALLMGARLIVLGWRIRTAQSASEVSAAQFRAFHDHLRQADALLSDVIADDPGNVAAWTERVTIARGLQLGIGEARRRYEAAEAARPHPFRAQLQLLQQLWPKWGGTKEAALAFANECATKAPPGSLNGAVLADAHLELAIQNGFQGRYLRRPAVVDQLTSAADRSVDHPDYQPVHGWVLARNLFASTLSGAGEFVPAAKQFAALDRRVVDSVWMQQSGSWTYKRRQILTYLRGGWRG
jgi:hypothetical protein